MEELTEDHLKLLLDKEWLVKTNTTTSTPYLFKFYASTVHSTCCILMTDMKSTWGEVLTSPQIARRWRHCNVNSPAPFQSTEAEDAWRTSSLELISKIHTLGAIAESSFEIVESKYADFAVELDCETFKWRWETCFLGHKRSSDIIARHLILPLISVNHLAFSSSDPLNGMSNADLEKAIDKVGRTARRSVDTHIKNALCKPHMATTIRRMTAMFNFLPDLPGVVSIVEKPDLQLPSYTIQSKARSESPTTVVRQDVPPDLVAADVRNTSKVLADLDSATESEHEGDTFKTTKNLRNTTLHTPKHEQTGYMSPPPAQSDNASRQQTVPNTNLESDPDSSSPLRPTKKAKMTSSDEDSEEERRQRVAQLKGGSGAGAAKRGTKQPIKRGGKRF